MPLDATGYLPQRVLTEDEARDLAILKAARHRIRHRWMWWGGMSSLRGAMAFFYGGSCAMQAVKRTTRWDKDARHVVYERLRAQLPRRMTIADYNDAPSTTHADILALYDRAIAELE